MKRAYVTIKNFIEIIVKRYSSGNVSDSAAVLAFYTLLSIFPIFFIIGSVLNMFHIQISEVEVYIRPLFPDRIYLMLEPIINSTLQSGGASQLSVGLIVTIWSASRAIAAFQRSINKTYGVAANQNAISNRLVSFVRMLVLILAVVLLIIVFAFSQMFFEWLNPILNVPHRILNLIGTVKWPVTIAIAWLLLSLLYYFVPTAKVKFRYIWVGALISTLGLMILAQDFTVYLRFFAHRIDAYKTIGTFIVLMFWLDFSGIIMLFGGVVNAAIQEIRQGKIQEQQDALETVWKRAQRIRKSRPKKAKRIKRSKK